MAKIRAYYGVPAKRGLAVKYKGEPATIKSSDGVYLRLRFAASSPLRQLGSYGFHPLWEIDYLDGVDYAARYEERVSRLD